VIYEPGEWEIVEGEVEQGSLSMRGSHQLNEELDGGVAAESAAAPVAGRDRARLRRGGGVISAAEAAVGLVELAFQAAARQLVQHAPASQHLHDSTSRLHLHADDGSRHKHTHARARARVCFGGVIHRRHAAAVY